MKFVKLPFILSMILAFFCQFTYAIDYSTKLKSLSSVNSSANTTKASSKTPPAFTVDEAKKLAIEAYIYAYPLITMATTKRVMTSVSSPAGILAPLGQFGSLRTFPTPEDKLFSTLFSSPNADLLYSSAWLDLTKEPYILHVPEITDRYYFISILSAWTNVIQSIGPRTTGTKAGDFAIVGPHWKGSLPKNIKRIDSPTHFVWVLGRTYSTGTEEDYIKVHKIQNQYSLTPLSAFGKSPEPSIKKDFVVTNPNIDITTASRDQVNRMNAGEYFKLFAELLKINPPGTEDDIMIKKLENLGITPGQDFDINKVDPNIAKALEAGVPEALNIIKENQEKRDKFGKIINGWSIITGLGDYGKNYLLRAVLAYSTLGSSLHKDALYPRVAVDSEGNELNGNNRYVIHFNKNETPPTNGFWSITVYNKDFTFYANPLKRYNLGSRDTFKYNEDGSLDIYLSHDSPGIDKEANWLPTPKGLFSLILRNNWPKDSFINGKWSPPAIKKYTIDSAKSTFKASGSDIKNPSKITATETSTSTLSTSLTTEEAQKLAIEAYIYAYPLVTMDITKRIMTSVSSPIGIMAPLGQFGNLRNFPTPEDKEFTAPNADTLYSSAWLDLSKEPYILHVPEITDRYYLLPVLSAWTNVIRSIGTRTTGTKARDYVIVGPEWKGTLPKNIERIDSPTHLVWLIGRTYSTGTEEDYIKVHKIQDQYTLTPLSAFGKSETPAIRKDYVVINPNIDMMTATREQVNKMRAGEFFKLFSELLKNNPPRTEDKAMIKNLEKLGIKPGHSFDINKIEPTVAKALESAVPIALKTIKENIHRIGKNINGWRIEYDLGDYGTDYLLRAVVAYSGLGANLNKDASYPKTSVDSEGEQLNGDNRYILHFNKNETPPVNGFWSITVYGPDLFFYANPIKRYNLGSRNKFKYNEDGSLDIYFQHNTPGKDKESNWLPVPKGPFNLILRLYWPTDYFLNGKWQPPAVKKIN